MTMRPCKSIVLSLTPRKPVLELDHAPVRHRDRAFRLLPHDPALAEELNDVAHAHDVIVGDVRRATLAEATAAMPCKPTNDGLVNVGDRDLGELQPVREVSGYGVVPPHCQGSMPRVQQIVRELCHPWGWPVCMCAL
jgi:hypothetical protein